MKKRLLSLLLAFVMVLGMMPVSAFATQPDAEPTVQIEPVQAETTEPVTEETTTPVMEETAEPVVKETTEPEVKETTALDSQTIQTETVAVTGVTLDQTTVKLEVGKTVTLTATVTPENATDKTVAWSSSDEKIATVADGVVTAVAIGEATITVTTNDGALSATCAVTVAEHEHVDENTDRVCDICNENLNHLPTLIEGVENRTVLVQTGWAYQVDDLVNGKIFTDADSDSLTYSYRKSSNGGTTWGEWMLFGETLAHGGLNKSLTNSTAGTYTYEFKANDGFGDSEARWILTLETRDQVPANVKFYLGQDHNYKTNGSIMPVLELYKTAGLDENLFDYVGWFEKDGKTEYVYNPQDYTIIDGETDYVVINEVKYELHDYEKITFTNSAFDAADETATASGTVVNNYNMFYAAIVTGRYSTRVYGYNATTSAYDIYLGGQSMELPMEVDIYGNGGNDIYLRQIDIYTTSKKLDDTYFTADDYYAEVIMPITGGMIHSGDPYISGNYTKFPFFMWAAGNGSLYNTYVYPKDTDSYIFTQAINNTTSAGTSVVSKSMVINAAIVLKVTVPAAGDFGLYMQYNNFNTKKAEPVGEATLNDDGTKTITYKISKSNGNYTWRLSDPSGTYVTKAGWLKNANQASEQTFTFSEFTNKASHDFSNLGTAVATRDEADLQVFLSASGFKSASGKTRVRAYRMWEIINSDSGNIMVEPDFNIQVLKGNASDIKLVNGGNAVNNWLDVTPTTTDIVAVNYDALEVLTTADVYGSHGGLFPATNPERTNVFVITNETAGTAVAHIPFNGSKSTDRGAEWDYNYDTWSYLNTDAQPNLDFTVTGTGSVDVSYATVITNDALKSTLSDWNTLTADEDGNYNVSLLPFRNAGTKGGTVIIKMTDSTGTSYALVRVAEMAVTVANVSNPGEPFMPGDQVSITFDGLYRSINKISGIFNPTTYYLRYTAGGVETNGSLGQYQQMDRASLTLTIPENIEFPEGQTTVDYSFTNGYVFGNMYSAPSPFQSMYYITDTGVGTNFSAVGTSFVLSRLADIPVTVQKKVVYDTRIQVTDGENILSDYIFTLSDPDGNALTPDENGIYQDLGYGEYTYYLAKTGYVCQYGTVKLGSADAENVVDGILVKTFVAEKAAEGAWDGTTVTEPAQIDGIYQISNGAELAWFAQAVNAGTTNIKSVLTADIDLACYNWTPIGNSSTKFAGSIDGQGHNVCNMAIINTAATTGVGYGFIGYMNGGSVQNLTVEGTIDLTNSASVSNGYTGGVIGACTGTVTLNNVHANVDITIDRVKGNWARVGGLVGSGGSITITNCSNSGDISGYQYVGGIVGYIANGTVTGCYNAGEISGYQYVGGIAASGAPGTVTSCYNIGDVTATNNYVGGIISSVTTTSALSNCFNAGTITFGGSSDYAGAVVGYSNNAKGTNANLYYLEGTYSTGIGKNLNDIDATAVTAETLASEDFVTAINAGLETAAYKEGVKHPVLTWQPDPNRFNVTFPTDANYTVIGAATAKEGADYTFTVELAAGYKAGESFCVKVNGEPVTATADGKYTVSNVTSDLSITVEGLEKIIVEPVSVYLSMSHDEAYLNGRESDTVMAFKNVEVPYFDLALYGMEKFYFSSESYGDDGDGEPGSALDAGTAAGAYGKITMLHLFLYATELYYCGLEPADAGKGYLYNERLLGTDTMTITGSVGSIYFSKLWGMDENLNYYHNYEYPLASEGWGSTADQILLKDGDIVTVGHFSDWLFHTDPGSVFNYIKAGDDVITTNATRGDRVKLSVIRAGADGSGKYSTAHTPVTSQPEVYCIAADQLEEGIVSNWTYLGTADENGEFILDTRKLANGQYIVAVAGQYGVSEALTESICSAPGGILLTIEGEPQPLSAPAVAVADNVKTGGVILSWEAVPGADGYQVYRATSSKGKYIKLGVKTTECAFEAAVPAGQTYYFKVVAVCDTDAALNSSFSNVVKFIGKCAQPAAKAETNTSGKPVLSWAKVSGAKKYYVYRSTNGGLEKYIGSTTKTSYTDTKTVVGVTYTYRIKSIGSKSVANGAYSEAITIRTICAQPALNIKIDEATGKPNLTWKSVIGAACYEIRRAESANGEFTVLEAQQYDLEYFDASAQPDKDYWYQVVALAREEALNNAITVKTHTNLAKPVVTFSADTKSGKPTLTWDAVEGAVSYKIYRSTKSQKSYKAVKTVTETSYTDSGVAVGKGYYYKVVAVGETSKSAYSAYKKLTAKCAQPEITVYAGATSGKPVIKWGKVASAKKYYVYRATVEDGIYRKVKTVTGTSYTDISTKVGTTYYYKVKAVASKAVCNSAYSEVKSCLTVLAQPALSVSIAAKTGKPVLNWKSISGAVKYEIYCDGEKLTEATKPGYTHETAVLDNKYTYKVVAVGETAELNAESAEKTVTCTCGNVIIKGKLVNKKPLISWEKVEGAVKYTVYRSTKKSSGFKLVGTVEDGENYGDTTAKKGTTYYYKVVAVTEGNATSAYSNTVKVKSK